MDKKEVTPKEKAPTRGPNVLVPELNDPRLAAAAREAAESARREKEVWDALQEATSRVVKRLRQGEVLTPAVEAAIIEEVLAVAEEKKEKILTPHTLAEGEVARRFAVRRLSVERRKASPEGEPTQP